MTLRSIWIVSLTVALSLALVACQKPYPEVSSPDAVGELCDDLVPLIAQFQEGVDRSETGDSETAVNQTRFAAKRIVAVIVLADRRSAEFSDDDVYWIQNVEASARSFVRMSEGELAELSDEEAMERLINIDDWFRYTTDRCIGTTA